MRSSDGGDGNGDRSVGVVGTVVRAIWEEDEVGHTATRDKVVVTSVLYAVAITLSVVCGGVLYLDGRFRMAYIVWIVWNGFFVVFGTITVGWNLLEYVDDRREAEDDPGSEGPERELAPEFEVSQDSKIAFAVTVVVILEILVVVKASQAVL